MSRLQDSTPTCINSRKYPGVEIGFTLQNEELAEINTLSKFEIEGLTSQDLQDTQMSDALLKPIISKLLAQDAETSLIYRMINGLLFKTTDGLTLLCIPDIHKNNVLKQYHSHALGGHMARDRLHHILKSRFFWYGMSKDISYFINQCEFCLKIKSRVILRHGRLQPVRVAKPFELVGIDIAYLPKSKGAFRYVLVAIDYFKNWVEAAVMKSLTAEELIRTFFKIIISKHGCPEGVISDSGVS